MFFFGKRNKHKKKPHRKLNNANIHICSITGKPTVSFDIKKVKESFSDEDREILMKFLEKEQVK